jgi:hypothetical protein
MPMKRFKPEQLVTPLRQIEVGDCPWQDHAPSLPRCANHDADVQPLARVQMVCCQLGEALRVAINWQ